MNDKCPTRNRATTSQAHTAAIALNPCAGIGSMKIERGSTKAKPDGWPERRYDQNGYIIRRPGQFSESRYPGQVFLEHRIVAEAALGKPLPFGAEVHHVDGNRSNNDPRNLVVCEDHAYHFLLEVRTRALRECGNPNWRRCVFCKEYDDPSRGMVSNSRNTFHRQCKSAYEKQRRTLRGLSAGGRQLKGAA